MSHRIVRPAVRWALPVAVFVAGILATTASQAGDWPQWRGPNRDAKVTGFTAPKEWPKDLTKKWSVPVGNGVATPALVGDKLYVYARVGGDEVLRCLDAASGKELWQDKHPAAKTTGGASGFPGPRSSPTVADGKVVVLGVQGALSCYDAASGKLLWRKADTGSVPRFYTSSSPLVISGLCIIEFGGDSRGGVAAYDLTTGEEKWKWDRDGAAYASPVLMTIDGTTAIIAPTATKIIALGTDGKLLWSMAFDPGKGPGRYNSSSPTVTGDMLVFSGSYRGTKAIRLQKQGAELTAKELWSNDGTSSVYTSPVVKDGRVYGMTSNDSLFCITPEGKTAWTQSVQGRRGYGCVVDVGPALLSLTPAGQLIVFEPTDKEFKEVARYKVADRDTYGYPIVAGNRIYIKDAESLTLYTLGE